MVGNNDDLTATARQAPMTASFYLVAAINEIDHLFEAGYARNHPELVAAYVQACTADFAAVTLCNSLLDIGRSVDSLSTTMATIACRFSD